LQTDMHKIFHLKYMGKDIGTERDGDITFLTEP